MSGRLLLLCNTSLPVQYISLDGNSLTSTDLVNLGRGLYKIKVMINDCILCHGLSVLIFNLNLIIPFANIFQLTAEAEKKVVQARELLDTIVKENKG